VARRSERRDAYFQLQPIFDRCYFGGNSSPIICPAGATDWPFPGAADFQYHGMILVAGILRLRERLN
jgi:hypothetical protein